MTNKDRTIPTKNAPLTSASAKAGPPPVDLSKAGLSAEALAKAGYKHTPLGWLPKEWEVRSATEICSKITVGIVIKPADLYVKDGIPCFRSGNVKENKIDDSNWVYISDESNEKNKKSKLQNGDVLVVRTGYPGTSCVVTKEFEGSNCIDLVLGRPIKSIILPEYLCEFINSDLGRRQVLSKQGGLAQQHFNVSDFKALNVALPPLPEQQQIAAILSAWDRAIDRTQALIAAKEERRRGVMQRLLTGRVRVKGFERAWREVKVKEIFSLIEESNDGLEHTVMTISARFGLISQKEKFDRVIAGDSLKRYTLIREGDFAYNKGNSKLYEMGCIYRLEDIESALVPFVYICFRPSGKIDSTFYKHWFLAHGLDRQLKKIITSGARGDGLLNVNKKDFFNLKVPLPPKEEQAIIGEILSKADHEVTLLQKKLEALQAQKKGLMQRLLTGRVRVTKIITNDD